MNRRGFLQGLMASAVLNDVSRVYSFPTNIVIPDHSIKRYKATYSIPGSGIIFGSDPNYLPICVESTLHEKAYKYLFYKKVDNSWVYMPDWDIYVPYKEPNDALYHNIVS